MKRKTLIVVALIVIVAGVIAAIMWRQRTPKNSNTLRVGVIAPLTGNASAYGAWMREGLEAAKKDLGLQAADVEIIYEDDRGDPKVGATAFQRLRDLNKVDVVMTVLTSTTLAVKPLSAEARIPLFTPVASHPDITGGSEYVFRSAINSRQEAQAMISHLEMTGLPKKIGVFYINDSGGLAFKDAFVSSYKGQIAGSFPFDKGNLDYRSMIASALASSGEDVDAFYVAGYGKEIGAVIRDLRQAGFSKRIVANQGVENQDVLNVAGATMVGIEYTFLPEPKSVPPSFRNVDKAPSPVTYASYEALHVLVEAQKLARSQNISLTQAMHQGSFEGIYSPVTFLPNGDIRRPVAIKIIKPDLSFAYVSVIEAT
jgi:branched-chain amino acid transport system substrate-binding protein